MNIENEKDRTIRFEDLKVGDTLRLETAIKSQCCMIGLSVNIKFLKNCDKYKFYELETVWLSDLMNEITSKFGVDCRISDDNSLSLLIGTTIKTGRDVRMRANIPDIPLMRGELEMDNAVSISKALKSKFPDHEIKLIFYNYLGNDYQC